MRTPRRTRLGPRAYEGYVAGLAAVATGRRPPSQADDLGLAEAALYHGVSGRLLAAARSGEVSLSARLEAAVEVAHAERMVRATLLRRELVPVARLIVSGTGARPILIKGPALAGRFHASLDERPFEDLDLLLPRAAIAPAADELLAGGWTRVPLPWPRRLERHAHAVELERRIGSHALGLELHWRISDDPSADPLDHGCLAAHAEPLPDMPDVLVPAVAEQLVLLAVHLVHHGDKRLVWLLDIAAVSGAAPAAEWQRAFALADAAGLGWTLDAALDLIRQHLGFERERPRGPVTPARWGPLRSAHVLGDSAIAYHSGHLATLGWRERAAYLATGGRRLLSWERWSRRRR